RTIQALAGKVQSYVLFGTENELNQSEEIEKRINALMENTTGMLDYQGLKLKVAECDLMLGNDTGTMHLAAAIGVPAVTVFGPTNHLKWNALTSTPVFLPMECRPCYYLSSMPSCDHINCLNQLASETVTDAVLERLRQLGFED
ncbi:glycosyltransferase family 9 protein, partial [Fibrobacterota bacterium]